eukprot:895389-Prorocentrum_minimum.AAC.1
MGSWGFQGTPRPAIGSPRGIFSFLPVRLAAGGDGAARDRHAGRGAAAGQARPAGARPLRHLAPRRPRRGGELPPRDGGGGGAPRRRRAGGGAIISRAVPGRAGRGCLAQGGGQALFGDRAARGGPAARHGSQRAPRHGACVPHFAS